MDSQAWITTWLAPTPGKLEDFQLRVLLANNLYFHNPHASHFSFSTSTLDKYFGCSRYGHRTTRGRPAGEGNLLRSEFLAGGGPYQSWVAKVVEGLLKIGCWRMTWLARSHDELSQPENNFNLPLEIKLKLFLFFVFVAARTWDLSETTDISSTCN